MRLVTEVADSYPRLLAWLTEGQVSRYWNVFGIWIAVLRLIPGVRWIVWLIVFKPVARHAPWRLALHEAILQDMRAKLNENRGAGRLSPKLALNTCTPGLSAVTDIVAITPTATRDSLRTRIEKMSSGCIGVTGLRGSGKSTVIRDFCGHRYGTPMGGRADLTELPGLRLKVQAPLRYDAREFLIHLYTCLCQAVLADVRLNPTSFVHRIVLSLLLPRSSIRPVALLRSLTGIALLVLAGGLAYRAVVGTWPTPSLTLRTWEWLGAAAAVVGALIVTGWRTRQALIEVCQVLTLATDAQARLEKLHFQRTNTHNRAGTLGAPMGTSLNLSSAQSFTEQMMTLPELTDDYRDFAERVVAALQQVIITDKNKSKRERNVDVRLVIGIDEIDQIEDAQNADRFLTELRSVFGTSHCVYLIPVSPGTLATDARVVPLKTYGGAIFDEMVWVEPLDLPTAGNLLDHRVIGLPVAFIALCYVLSGGLPRDLLRIARAIFMIKSDGTGTELELAYVTENVIKDELRALARRVMALAVSLEIPAVPDLLGLLDADARPVSYTGNSGPSPRHIDIKAIMDDFSQLWAGKGRQRFADLHGEIVPLAAEICDSFLAGLYFLLTVHQLFTADPDLVTKLAAWPPKEHECKLKDDSTLKGLAHARTTLGMNTYLGAEIIRETREAFSGSNPGLFADTEPDFLNSLPSHHAGQPDKHLKPKHTGNGHHSTLETPEI